MSGGRRSRPLSDAERALWDGITRSIAPLKRRKVAAKLPPGESPPVDDKPKGKAAAKPLVGSTPAAPRSHATPPLAPLGRRMKQKVARGSEPIDRRIDLHGMTQSEAHHALARFLRSAQRGGARLVLVITGKGARNAASADADTFAERGVLKRQVPLWLESAELRPLVVGFESAGIGHGGQGALYVRVRRLKE
jgi:DNA-nicking Smr family endonuclease